jgi:hypothetical protein
VSHFIYYSKRIENNILFSSLLFSSLIVTSCLVFTYGQINIHEVQAHLEHLPHYNAGESRIGYGDYMSFMALDPDYGTTDYPTTITFSIQDFDGNDVYIRIAAMSSGIEESAASVSKQQTPT